MNERADVHYELYIDLFFCVNLIVDYILLQLLKRFFLIRVSNRRVFLGAFIGSLSVCLLIAIPAAGKMMTYFVLHGLINTGMLMIGLRMKAGKELLRGMMFLYFTSLILGGFLGMFAPYLDQIFVFISASFCGYLIVQKIWDYFLLLMRKQVHKYSVKLIRGEKQFIGTALVDTGNYLKDPVTHKPIHVVSQSVEDFFALKEGENVQNFRKIPYQTVGNPNGMMRVMEVDYLVLLDGKQTKMFAKQEIGLGGDGFEQNNFDVILNPEIMGGI